MKSINTYIDDKIITEGLLSWLKAFIKKVKNNQNRLIGSNGKVNMISMDTDKLKIQKEPANFKDLIKDKDTVEIWNNKKTGFPATANIAKNVSKYCPDQGDIKSEPLVYTFYYNGDNTYYAAVILYDAAVQYIENYLHIISIETNLVVDNPTDVVKAIFNQFKNEMANKNKSILGFTAKDSIHPKMRGILNTLRFNVSEDNNEIYKLDK